MAEKAKRKLWYVRRKDDVRGPFPCAAISQYILLGRLHPADEVSRDKIEWQRIADVPELTPEVMQQDQCDPKNQADLEVAMRGADERTGHDRRGGLHMTEEERRHAERRAAETAEMMAHRQDRASRKLEAQEEANKKQSVVLIGLLAVLCSVLVLIFYAYEPAPYSEVADCTAPPAPLVNWSNCTFNGDKFEEVDLTKALVKNAQLNGASFYRSTLSGIDLSYSDLSTANMRFTDLVGANLFGATLRHTDLRGAVLVGADLSYADMAGARLDNARLEGVKLDKAVWPDGRICAVGSVGTCL